MANIRSAYAVVQAAALTGDNKETIEKNNGAGIVYDVDASGNVTATVTLKQGKGDWQSATHDLPGTVTGTPAVGGTATVTFTKSSNTTAIAFS